MVVAVGPIQEEANNVAVVGRRHDSDATEFVIIAPGPLLVRMCTEDRDTHFRLVTPS